MLHFISYQTVCGADFHRYRVEGVLDEMHARIMQLADEIKADGFLDGKLR